ncbi:uncharacterized protein LOC131149079 isoform X2 [Malania oleifera]|uniref:uncharacterized protein LOC131149079 isoform X2 n=1 Tax=Malania oleifera TaxID=397392 RepID=UPI0025AE68D3|nr:uncharacterized protein LOC131149079 isoform X2 [Malania oleifera]
MGQMGFVSVAVRAGCVGVMLMAFAIHSSARNTIFLSSGKEMVGLGGGHGGGQEGIVRSLLEEAEVHINDYGNAGANHGHDPWNRFGGGRPKALSSQNDSTP